MNLRPQRAAAFTLLEIMIVLGIIAIMFGVAVPAFVQMRQKKPLVTSVEDLLEGLKQARATAILTGKPVDFIITMEGRSLSLQEIAAPKPEGEEETNTRMANAAPKGFSGKISDELQIDTLGVNFHDIRGEEEARVRFHPNGTSDEFAIVLHSADNEYRMIKLEIITGLASVEVDPNKFLNK